MNPAHASWNATRARICLEPLIRRCHATQLTCEALRQRLQPLAMFARQPQDLLSLRSFAPALPLSAVRPLRIGWGRLRASEGSAGRSLPP